MIVNNINHRGEMMDHLWTSLERLLPERLRHSLKDAPKDVVSKAEEIRLRTGVKPSLLLPGGEITFADTETVWNELAYVLDRASKSSLHSVARELKNGYISAESGIRIGVCGRFTTGGIESFQDVSSIAIRIPHEIRGVGEETIKALAPYESSVLVVSPPGGGKTTFLRELIRVASESGKRVAVCDERNEIAAMRKGRTAFDLGKRTDVLCGAGKAEGIIMLMRSMNPEIIAVDEIAASDDVKAIEQAAGCGASIFASVHGSDMKELKKRPALNELLMLGIFRRAVIISGREKHSYDLVNL